MHWIGRIVGFVVSAALLILGALLAMHADLTTNGMLAGGAALIVIGTGIVAIGKSFQA